MFNPLMRQDMDHYLENLIQYDDQRFPFCDRFSRFGVVFSKGTGMGPGNLYPKSVLATYRLTDPLLGLCQEEDGVRLPVYRRCRRYSDVPAAPPGKCHRDSPSADSKVISGRNGVLRLHR